MGWWDTRDRLLSGAAERAIISNWQPEMEAVGRDLWWFSMLEAEAAGRVRQQPGGGHVVSQLGAQIGAVLPAFPFTFTLGAEKTAVASLGAFGANSIASTVDGKRVATAIGDGTFGLTHTIGSGIQNKLHRVRVRWSGNTGGILFADLGNISMQFSSAADGDVDFFVTPTSLTAVIIYISGGTGAGRTFAVDEISVAEVTNFEDFSMLSQSNGTLRFLYGRQPVTGVRNLLLNSAFVGAVAGSPGTPPTNWSIVQTGGTLSLSGEQATISTSSARHYWSRDFNLLANTTYFFSTVADISVAARVDNLFNVFGLPSGATAQHVVDGVDVAGSTIPATGVRQIGVRVAVGATGGTATINLGAGVTTGASTSTVAFSAPQVEIGTSRTAYQRTGTQGTLDVTEAGVPTIPIMRADLNDDRMGVILRSKNRLPYPSDINNDLVWIVQNATRSGIQVSFPTGPASDFLRNNGVIFPAGVAQTISFRARTVSGNNVLRVDLQNIESNDFTLTSTMTRYTWTVTPAAQRIWLDFCTVSAGVIEITDIQVELGSVATDFEGNVIGTGIIAGRAGTWVETVDNPRLIGREIQTALSTGFLLPGSPVLGLPAIVHGPSTDPSRGLVDALFYDRVLSEAEIARVMRRLKAAGAKGRWTLGANLWDNIGVTVDAGWTNNGNGSYTRAAGTSAANNVRDTIGLINGGLYRVDYTISGRTAGQFRVDLGGAAGGVLRATNGTFAEIITARTNALAYLTGADTLWDGTVSAISIRQLIQES